MKIAIAGVRRSGKSWLAAKLSEALVGHQVTEMGTLLPGVSRFDVVLLMGLDLAPQQPNLQSIPWHKQGAEDQDFRNALASLGKAFHVIYGNGDTRLQNALRVIQAQLTMHSIAAYTSDTIPAGQLASTQSENWRWPCEKCSDPDCEHQLFSRLIS